MDTITTHYAVGVDPYDPIGTNVQNLSSSDKVYTNPVEFLPLADCVVRLLDLPDYKPFPYSDLRTESGVLYYPVSEGTSRVRFGTTLYDIQEGVFVLDTSREANSLIVMDYNKYLGRGMSLEEKDDLAFLLNMYRTCRSPLYELNLLNKSGDPIAMTQSLRPNAIDPSGTQLYLEQMSRLANMWGNQSKVLPTKATAPQTGPAPKLSPLLKILADFLSQSGFNSTPTTTGIAGYQYDSKLYEEWYSSVLEPIAPKQVLEFMVGRGALMIYIFQFLAHHPGMLNKLMEAGALGASINGSRADDEVPAIYKARNQHLLENSLRLIEHSVYTNDMPASMALLDNLPPEAVKTLADYAFFRNDTVTMYRNFVNDGKSGDQYIADNRKNYMDPNSTEPLSKDMRIMFDIANTGLIPLESSITADVKGTINQMYPGLGLRNYVESNSRSSALPNYCEQLVKFEEEAIRGTDFTMHATNSNGVVDKYDLRDMSAFLITDTEWSKQSTASNFKKVYSGYFMTKSLHSRQFYTSLVNGRDSGAINPMANWNVSQGSINQDQSSRMGAITGLASETSSFARGAWYKLDFESLRSTRVALERVLGQIESALR